MTQCAEEQPVGEVFRRSDGFWFLLRDERDGPRGPYPTVHEAMTACLLQEQAKQLWELMVDT